MKTMNRIRRPGLSFLMAAALVAGLLAAYWAAPEAGAHAVDGQPQAPAFTQQGPPDWLNSPPLAWSDLRGQVVLLDFWTFMCWNCYRSFPWLTGLEERLKDRDFRVIGVHTPEFEAERDRTRIAERADHFGLHHPIMVDNDHAYWKAMGNRYWPAYYLIDRQGRVRHYFVGETHAGDERAVEIEARIRELLAEPTD